MSGAVRVVHLPARTPYVRKIVSADIELLNGNRTRHGIVPAAVGAEWLLRHRPLDWLDVVHLHHIEFEDLLVLEDLLDACANESVKVVCTAHDLVPMFTAAGDLRARLELVAQSGASWIGLTESSAAELRQLVPAVERVRVIPHGYVVAPDDLMGRVRQVSSEASGFLMYGALRPNRGHLTAVTNWSLAVPDPHARLSLLLRPFNPADFGRYNIDALLSVVRADDRISATMQSYPSDATVVEAGLRSDALLLPYSRGTHSGQLELAFDLNMLAVCSSVGHLREQALVHGDRVIEPIWFDWGDGRDFLYGERLVAALETAGRQLVARPRSGPSQEFSDYRRDEHTVFLAEHRETYLN
ncbi:glycosyltransferase [Nocardia sp. NBC_00881]|uniref:hypothetical protein n=1 Tax=Nocardia sp. NBC_00881 TaxID=2975995 RepID=UPI00386F4BFF|nr:glycosyltransferase [Nocardia sp. NBC_00881]